jgi:fimbrial chaperone protein
MIDSATRVVALCAVTLFLAGVSVASAGMIGLSPLRVDFDSEKKSGLVRVFNTGDTDISMQVDIRDWSQSDTGEDQFEPATDVVAMPPIFSLAPGEMQLIRLGLVGDTPTDRESTYRLFFTELPPAPTNGGLRMRLIVSMPVFSLPAVDLPAKNLEFVEMNFDDEEVRVRFHNPGERHIRVENIATFAADGRETGRIERPRYILPGANHDFVFDSETASELSRLAVTNTAGTVEYDVAIP